MAQKDFTNKLILGDNLQILQSIPDKSVDLIYLDPPFFSNRTYEVIWGDDGEKRSFEDRFAGGIDHYISWLKVRVRQMHRILKDTGSIFLHCDWHANAEIKVDILNKIFGRNNFRNEIVWCYKTRPQSKKYFGRKHDVIFFYTKSENYTFNWENVVRPLSEATIAKYRLTDENGRLYRLQGRGIQDSPIRSAKDVDAKWEQTNPEWVVRDYLDEKIGVVLEDWWIDFEIINQNSNERIGYPTQKPEALLQRIIECATNEGDVVLDPFVGGGTTIAVADRLNRRWIGIDQSVMAIKVSDLRMKKRVDDLFDKKQPYEVILPTFDLKKLQATDGKDFEIWIVDKYGGIPNEKGGKDLGIDGHTQAGTPIQVKKWKKPVGRDTLDAFVTAIKRDDVVHFEKNKKEGQICGFIIGFDFSKDIINAVAQLKNKENIIIELKYIKDIIPYDNPPKVTLTAEELEDLKYKFEANAESETGIDFFSWDLSHNEKEFRADVIMDKKGVQEKKFSEGEHRIAVQAVDKKGLSGTDKVKIDVKRKKMKITPKFLTLLCALLFLTGCTEVKREYYENGKLKSETHYRFGKETGTTTYFHYWYSTKIMEVEMKKGKRNGKFVERYFNNNIKMQAFYKNDLSEGKETHYYIDGNRSLEINYTKGMKNGPVTSWYDNGIVKESGFYVNDLYDGNWENYDKRGLLIGEGTFEKGTGKKIVYDEMGRLQCETNYVNNKKEGLETYFFPSGEIEKTILFKEDRIIEINGVPVDSL